MFRGPVSVHAVQKTSDLDRVLALPRRTWTDAEAADLADKMTALLRTPTGTMTLRTMQAIALYEAWLEHGLLMAGRVGIGKSLLAFLLPYCLKAKRPLLLVPAKLQGKTVREIRRLSIHWVIPNFIRIVSYELLGRVQSQDLLTNYRPDLIIMDECHRTKNPKAAVTRRVMRYLAATPSPHDTGPDSPPPEPILVNGQWFIPPPCVLVGLSGTITNRSIMDYAHLLRRCVGARNAPIPATTHQTEDWAGAIDERRDIENRVGTGALVLLCDQAEAELHRTDPIAACRRAYRRRLIETSGMVATAEVHDATCSLTIQAIDPPMSAATDMAFEILRTKAELPDGQPTLPRREANPELQLKDGPSVWRHTRTLGLGFFYLWDPVAPAEWMKRRKEWYAACRSILTNNRRNLDSELHVTQAVLAGLYPEATQAYMDWCEVRDSFKPHTVATWFDDSALKAAATWAKGGPGIIWTEQIAFGTKLSEVTGLPYYGKKGVNAKGQPIPEFGEPGSGEGVIVASIQSNGEGRNLQAWNRNLLTCPPQNGKIMEQLLGRTHRDGQVADEVSFDVFVTCAEYAEAFWRATGDARYVQETIGSPQKLLYADVDMPTGHRRRGMDRD